MSLSAWGPHTGFLHLPEILRVPAGREVRGLVEDRIGDSMIDHHLWLMPDTRGVSFFKRIIGEDGRSFLSRLDRFEVDRTESNVVETAITEFERKHDIDDWRQLAHRYRVAS